MKIFFPSSAIIIIFFNCNTYLNLTILLSIMYLFRQKSIMYLLHSKYNIFIKCMTFFMCLYTLNYCIK